MECSCDIDPLDNCCTTEPIFYSQIDVIAIVDHICDDCERTIKQDEAYELIYGCWHSNAKTYHTCSDCLNLRHIFFPYGYFLGGLWNDFICTLNDCDYQIPEDCMVKLSKRNFNKVCEEIEKGWKFLEGIEK